MKALEPLFRLAAILLVIVGIGLSLVFIGDLAMGSDGALSTGERTLTGILAGAVIYAGHKFSQVASILAKGQTS